MDEYQSSSFLSSDPFPFPIIEPVPQVSSSTPPLDLSQFPATIDNIFFPEHPTSSHFGNQPYLLSSDSPYLIYPHPQPKSPYHPQGNTILNADSDYSPPSPRTIANATMQELTQLSPDLRWDNLPEDRHYSHNMYEASPDHTARHRPQDILSSALVLNDIAYDAEYSFEHFPNDEFLLQTQLEERSMGETEGLSGR